MGADGVKRNTWTKTHHSPAPATEEEMFHGQKKGEHKTDVKYLGRTKGIDRRN